MSRANGVSKCASEICSVIFCTSISVLAPASMDPSCGSALDSLNFGDRPVYNFAGQFSALRRHAPSMAGTHPRTARNPANHRCQRPSLLNCLRSPGRIRRRWSGRLAFIRFLCREASPRVAACGRRHWRTLHASPRQAHAPRPVGAPSRRLRRGPQARPACSRQSAHWST